MAHNPHRSKPVHSRSFRSQSLNTIENLDCYSTSSDSAANESDSSHTITGTSVTEVSLSRYVPYNTVAASIRSIACEYEIRSTMADRLQILRDFEIVIVCDDSGSMMATVDNSQRTRWDELCSIVKIVLKIGVVFDSNGVDIHFLNRQSWLNVKNPRDVDRAFESRPSGYTPLVPVLNRIFESPLSHHGRDKKLLVFVATDGEPTDENGNSNLPQLDHLMREKRQSATTYVSFLLCTDDPACVSYLNEWDRTMTSTDVTDDFNTEREKIRRYRGNNYPFSLGDYVVKALIGAVDPEIDAINEPA